MDPNALLADISFDLTLEIVKLYDTLVDKKEVRIAKQLFRSGTRMGMIIFSATRGPKKPDYASEMATALKEAHLTKHWLQLLEKSPSVKINLNNFLQDIDDIIYVLNVLTGSGQSNLKLEAGAQSAAPKQLVFSNKKVCNRRRKF